MLETLKSFTGVVSSQLQTALFIPYFNKISIVRHTKAVQIHSKAGRPHFNVMVEDSTANSITKVALPTVASAVYGQDCLLIID